MNKDEFRTNDFFSHFPECKLSRSGPPATIIAIDEESPNGKVVHPFWLQPVRVYEFNVKHCPVVWPFEQVMQHETVTALAPSPAEVRRGGWFSPELDSDIKSPVQGKFHNFSDNF